LAAATFDVSLVELDAGSHTVLASEGISNLGGDDFDHILAEMAVGEQALGCARSRAELFRLQDECRRNKKRCIPTPARSWSTSDVLHEGMGPMAIPVAEFYARCQPLIDETLAATSRLAARNRS